MTSTILFYVFLACIFLLEGLGVRGGREVAFYLILIMPFFLFFHDFISRREIYTPKFPTIFYGLFIFFSAFSTLFSVDRERSVPYLLFYISLYFIFIYVINHRKEVKKYIIPFLFTFTVLYIGYFLLLQVFLPEKWNLLVPEHGYQLVYAKFGIHNHIGDFLVLPIIACLYYFYIHKYRLVSLLSLLILLVLVLYSYSRSAYLSLLFSGVTMVLYLFIMMRKKVFSLHISVGLFLFVIVSLFLIASAQENSEIPIMQNIKSAVTKYVDVREKVLISDRMQFIQHAWLSTIKFPLLGVGPNNYIYVSQEHIDALGFSTYSSHNIFIDVVTESGVLAGLFFIILIGVIIKSSEKRNLVFFLLLALTINFQTDYTFRISCLLLLFFIFAGLLQVKPLQLASKKLSAIAISISVLLFLTGQYILLSGLLGRIL